MLKSVQKLAGSSRQPHGRWASPQVVDGQPQSGSQAALLGRPAFCASLRQSSTQTALRCQSTWTASKLSLRQWANSFGTSGHANSHASSHASGARISDLNPSGRSAHGSEDWARKVPFKQEKHTMSNAVFWVNIMSENSVFPRNIVLKGILSMASAKLMNAQDSSRLISLLEENLPGREDILTLAHALRESEHKHRSILEDMDLGYMEVDVQGVVTHVHPRFTAMTGYTAEDLLGKNGDVMLDDDGQAIMANILKERAHGHATSYEVPVRHRLGHRIWLLITGAPLRSLSGDVTGSVGIHFDVTERKEMEMQTNRAMASEALARQRERDLLMKMSHEIRTPINAINGMFHLMNAQARGSDEDALWQGAKRATAMLRQVVDEVLTLTKLEAGSQKVKRQKVDVHELTEGLAKMHFVLAEESEMQLVCTCRLLQTRRVLDADKWIQILTNLLSNAMKYAAAGTVKLDIWEEADRPDWIFAEVKDQGQGVAPEMQGRIFEVFGVKDESSHSGMGSTGLGLAIAKEQALLMGGDLLLMPSDKGARFVLELPAPTWKHKEKQSPESGGSHSVPDWDGRHLQVLVAEDNDLNILYLKALLQKWDVRFDIVRDGLQALEALKVATYDVLLLDVQMPEMDGISTLIELRKRDIKGRSELALPVFMVTAFADDETRKMATRHGANGFLAKPFSPEAMLDVLKIAEY